MLPGDKTSGERNKEIALPLRLDTLNVDLSFDVNSKSIMAKVYEEIMANNKPIAYSYIRFSTPEQLKGDSLRRQLDKSQKYAEEHGLDLSADFTIKDLGVSAFHGLNAKKGELGVFLTAVKEGRIPVGAYLLIENLDRLSRLTPFEAFDIFSNIIKGGINIVTLDDNILYNRDTLELNIGNLYVALGGMYRGHNESKTKSLRISASWENKRQNAENKKLTAKCPSWLTLDADRKNFSLIPEKADAVKLVYKYALDGYGAALIAKKFNELGIPSLADKGWHVATVHKILKNPAVIGEYWPYSGGKDRAKTGEVIKGYYPVIIDENTYNAVQQVKLKRSKEAGRKGHNFSNLFTSLCRCGYCGANMVYSLSRVHKKTGKKYRYYACTDAKRGMGCKHYVYVDVTNFEELFFKYCRELDVSTLIDERSDKQTDLTQSRILLASMNEKRKQTQLKLQNVIRFVEEGGEVSSLLSRIKELQSELDSLDGEIPSLEKDIRFMEIDLASVENVFHEMQELYSRLASSDDFDLRLRVNNHLKQIIKRILFFPLGPLHDGDEVAKLSADLKEAGYSDNRIEAYITDRKLLDGDKAKCYFSIFFRNGAVRTFDMSGLPLEATS